MKIAIVGAGVAGSYLAFMLSTEHTVDLFEKKTPENLSRDCAWGTSLRMLQKYAPLINRKPSDYLRFVGKNFVSKGIINRDTVTFNKHQFFQDLLNSSNALVYYKHKVTTDDLLDYDLVIDATGSARSLLPPPQSGLKDRWVCPCYQLDIRSDDLPEDFYFEPKGVGYMWVFPQGNGVYKVGCGSFDLNPRKEVEKYLSGMNYEVVGKVGAGVRLVPPSRSRPFYSLEHPPVIGVGEAIGTVSMVSGEGIYPSLICADHLLQSLKEKNIERTAKVYESRVLEEFRWMDSQFKFIYSVRYGNYLSQLWNLFRLEIPDYSCGTVSKIKMVIYNRPV
ncbi:MAG: hypothetical protein ACOC5L_00290 [Halobacteriota archaeon]